MCDKPMPPRTERRELIYCQTFNEVKTIFITIMKTDPEDDEEDAGALPCVRRGAALRHSPYSFDAVQHLEAQRQP